MKYRAILFDFDYTLGDSTDCIVAGFRYGMKELGWPEPSREAVRDTIGFPLEDAYTMLTGDSDPQRQKAFRPLFQGVANPMQRTGCQLFPGCEELLGSLKAQNIRTGIVSTKGSDTLESILEYRNMMGLLDFIIGGDRVKKSKPDPEGLLIAQRELGLPGEEILFCGDTVMDAGAAKNAGIPFAAVLNGTTKAQAFEEWPCEYVAEDLPDLKKWLDV